MLHHRRDLPYRMLRRYQIIRAARYHRHLPTLRGPQPNRRLAPRRPCLALRLDRGDFFPPRRQLLHPQLCIIIVINISHVDIISSINELASENFALGVKYLWKKSKKSQALSEARDLQFRGELNSDSSLRSAER